MTTETRKKAEELWHKLHNEDATTEEMVRLADCEYELGNREQSARILLEAIKRDPEPDYPRKVFNSRFSMKDLKIWNLPIPPTPIKKDLKNILMYPLSHNKWATLLVLAVAVKFTDIFGLFGPLVSMAFFLIQFSMHLNWSSMGKPGDPGPLAVEFFDLKTIGAGLIASFLPAVLCYALLDIPALTLGLTLVGIFIFPMSYLVAEIFNEGEKAFNYLFIFQSISKIFQEYVLTQVLMFAMFLAHAFLPTPHLFAAIIINFNFLYLITVSAHLIGRLYYVNQKKLNWFD